MLEMKNPEILKSRVMMNEYGTDRWSETTLRYNKKTIVTTLNAIGEDIEGVDVSKGEKGGI